MRIFDYQNLYATSVVNLTCDKTEKLCFDILSLKRALTKYLFVSSLIYFTQTVYIRVFALTHSYKSIHFRKSIMNYYQQQFSTVETHFTIII